MSIKLIAGLRNPGPQYSHTRHNAGEWFIQALALQEHVNFHNEKSMQSAVGQLQKDNQICKIQLPLTYMNHSGLALRSLSQFYKIGLEEILIVRDELDLPPGVLRLKTGGGHGGHNGLRDIISALGGNGFHRLRVGIGHPGHKDGVLDYVLGKPSSEDKRKILESFPRGLDLLSTILSGDIAAAMNQLNGS